MNTLVFKDSKKEQWSLRLFFLLEERMLVFEGTFRLVFFEVLKMEREG